MTKPAVLALVGPTASGKSAIAERLAQALPNIQLINTDPYQAYQELSIGTAKPQGAARQLYALIDALTISEPVDAVGYSQLVTRQIDQAWAGGKTPVLVGGSGFYLRTLERPLDAAPELDDDASAELQRRLVEDRASLHHEIRTRWPQVDLAITDEYRMQRYGARIMSSAVLTPIADCQPIRYLGLWAEGDQYNAAVAARVDAMWAAGWAGEVAQLCDQCPAWDSAALRAIGYDLIRDWIAKGRPAELTAQLLADIATATRRYAKRQRTWFRKNTVHWIPRVATDSQLEFGVAVAGRLAQRTTLFTAQ